MAPPCQQGIGQNVDGCETAFGQSTTTGNEREGSISVSAKAIAGFKIDGLAITQSEFEVLSYWEE